MDFYKLEPPRPVRVRKASPPSPTAAPAEDATKPPLGPSEKNNAAVPFTRRPRTSDVPSRYKSGISSAPASAPGSPRRCASPTAGRTAPPQGTAQMKRPVSAERRRPMSPSSRFSAPSSPSSRPFTPSSPSSRSTTPLRDTLMETHNAARRLTGSRAPDVLWPSMRSLSSSFQSESCTFSASRREKLAGNCSSDQTVKYFGNASTERKRTSLPGRNLSENYKPVETSNVKVIDQHRWPAMLGGRVSSNALSRSIDLTDKANKSTGSSRGLSPRRAVPALDGANVSLHQSLSDVARRLTIDGIKKSEGDSKFSLILSSQSSERSSSATRPSRTVSLPTTNLLRPLSPIRVFPVSSSTPRAMLSPSRTRSSTPTSPSNSAALRMGATSSVFNYIMDLRKGKRNENHIEDAHQLKLLYNSDLQWCFVNAHIDDTLASQKMRTENLLYDAWNNISKLRASVITKRIYVKHLCQEMKLFQILKEQMTFLEHWVAVEREHCSSLSGAFEALKKSTLRVPVTGGAKADIRAINGAISSAVDIMQALGSTICYLLSKADGTRALVSNLAFVVAEEKAMLDECRELLASVGAMQVQESSLRAHLIQLKQDTKMGETSINCRSSNHQTSALFTANS